MSFVLKVECWNGIPVFKCTSTWSSFQIYQVFIIDFFFQIIVLSGHLCSTLCPHQVWVLSMQDEDTIGYFYFTSGESSSLLSLPLDTKGTSLVVLSLSVPKSTSYGGGHWYALKVSLYLFFSLTIGFRNLVYIWWLGFNGMRSCDFSLIFELKTQEFKFSSQ